MKRYTICSVILATLVSGQAFASSQAPIQHNKKITMDWTITNANDEIDLINSSQGEEFIYIAVRKDMNGADPATVTGCIGGTQSIAPGSLLICEIEPASKAVIKIASKDFKYGTSGEYSSQ